MEAAILLDNVDNDIEGAVSFEGHAKRSFLQLLISDCIGIVFHVSQNLRHSPQTTVQA